jgi:DNA invertase Pin-like site-specific DNA recombinase
MAKELIFQGPGAGPTRAAEYIRMSTEHQRYSPDNQRIAIAAFAAYRGYEIVRTYQDSGKSGLTLSGRPALKQMLSDVLSGAADFQTILVLDVSRWGRFQNTDQAAHYEFMCRDAGVAVHYCTESFENDGAALSSIIKHMKRVMAAEYSRELSGRVSRAQRYQASLGFKQGSRCPLGLRRQVIDEEGKPVMILQSGERKALSTHKVIYAHGPAKEVALVQRIFGLYVHDDLSLVNVAGWLNKRKHKQPNGKPWSSHVIKNLLRNELYVGRYIFGRKRNNLGQRAAAAETDWAKAEVLVPIVTNEIFEAAQTKFRARKYYSSDELVNGLSQLLAEKGRLNRRLIQECPYLPIPKTLVERFGTMAAAYRTVNYVLPPQDPRNANGDRFSDEELLEIARSIYCDKGYLDPKALDENPATPNYRYYQRRFGGIRNVLALLGLDSKVDPQRTAALQRWRNGDGKIPQVRKAARHLNADGSVLSSEQLLNHLRRIWKKQGHLTNEIIKADAPSPDWSYYASRFGGLMKAYALIGYHSTRKEIAHAAADRGKQARTPRGKSSRR